MNNEIRKKERNYSLDFIRSFALFSVISIHFFMNTGYYKVPLEGEKLLVMTMARSFFMVCVPLFTMLTGYLQNTKRICREYYRGISRILITYLLASLCCLLFNWISGTTYTMYDVIRDILNYTMAPYGWYVEMFMGLFLLTPFLNVLWNNLENKKHKQYLILTMIILTTLPSIFNTYHFGTNHVSSQSTEYFKLLPFWWKGMWPVTYYFLGCYINDYDVIIQKTVNIVLIILITIVTGLFNFLLSEHDIFLNGIQQDWFSLPVMSLTFLVFVLLLNMNINYLPDFIKKIIYKISKVSFGAYLVSYIFDKIFYEQLNTKIEKVTDKFPYFFIIVPIIFIYSIVLSYLLELTRKFLRMRKI